MSRTCAAFFGVVFIILIGVLQGALPPSLYAQASVPPTVSALSSSSSEPPMTVDADRITYNREVEVYEADGSVVFVQGDTRLTSDHLTINMLTGKAVATGHVHITKKNSEVWAEQSEVNINSEAGIITSGRLFNRETNSTLRGRVIQRFSEDHYRAKDGSFTNCNAMEGETPAWRFTFKDVEANIGDSLYLRDTWFCVANIPILPLPSFNYPFGVTRKTGLLFPTPGFNSQFGFTYRQSFFWAVTPSQDITITPQILTNRGFGGDLKYRYLLSRRSKGEWLLNALQDTDQQRGRGLLTGYHTSRVTPTLSVRANVFLTSDRTYLQDFGTSGAVRALPSGQSRLDVRQRFRSGALYLLGQYLQPLEQGGTETFQRLPEIGHQFYEVPIFNTDFAFRTDTAYVHFFREKGFNVNRINFVPTFSYKPVSIGHVLTVAPEVRPRVVYYSRGVNTEDVVGRETIWSSLRAKSRLRRRFHDNQGGILSHTIEPEVVYEYVPNTRQADLVQIDNVDNLPKKHLLTYSLQNRFTSYGTSKDPLNLLNLRISQSYHVENPPVGLVSTQSLIDTQSSTGQVNPLSPFTTQTFATRSGKRFSDIWARGVLGNVTYDLETFQATGTFLTVDTFFDPYRADLSQINTDLRYQYQSQWYIQVGQRFARAGDRVQRGDIWNPLSLGDTFETTTKIQFLTASAAVKLPYGWTVGARVFRDIETNETPELDVVALYQNPCRCWSAGLYFIRFPDRNQVSFLINLTGIGNTDSFGTQLLRSLLEPLLPGEKGLPWVTNVSGSSY